MKLRHWLVLSLVLLLLPFTVKAQVITNPRISPPKLSIYPYTARGAWMSNPTNAAHVDDLRRWIHANFLQVVNGPDLYPDFQVNPYVSVGTYLEEEFTYPANIALEVIAAAELNGWNYENMLLHSTVDYQTGFRSTVDLGWVGMDRFDIFESTTAKGVLVYNGSTYYDATAGIYAGTCAANCTIPNGSSLYAGYGEPFGVMNFVLSQVRSGGSATWEYCSAQTANNCTTWSSLTPASDTTGGLTASGSFSFIPPANWVKAIVNNSRTKYWVRVTLAGTSLAPVVTTLKGDDLRSTAAPLNARGWCLAGATTVTDGSVYPCTSSTHVNVGMGNLEYDPTPPAGHSAHFRYQARVIGKWAANGIHYDRSDCQGTPLAWDKPGATCSITIASILRQAWIRSAPGTSNSVMLDDANQTAIWVTTGGGPAFNFNLTDYSCAPNCTTGPLEQLVIDEFHALRGMFNLVPNADHRVFFALTPNGGNTMYSVRGLIDMTLQEFAYTPTSGPIINYTDNWLPAVNPATPFGQGTIWMGSALFNYLAGINSNNGAAGYDFTYEMNNRGPMAALASYYVAANVNTGIMYSTVGGALYNDVDEFYYWAPSGETVLTSDLHAGRATESFTVADGSAFAAIPTGTAAPPGGGIFLQIGDRDVIRVTKTDNTHFTTSSPSSIFYSIRGIDYHAGARVRFAKMGHWSYETPPGWQDIWYYANFYPAQKVDIGDPDPNGWNSGARGVYMNNLTFTGYPACTSGCPQLWRRDYTQAIVLFAPGYGVATTMWPQWWDTYSPPAGINLMGPSFSGPYCRLNADGTVDQPITSLQLRGGEAAILMKPGYEGCASGVITQQNPGFALPIF